MKIKTTFVEDLECHQLEDYRNQQTIVEESAKHVFATGSKTARVGVHVRAVRHAWGWGGVG